MLACRDPLEGTRLPSAYCTRRAMADVLCCCQGYKAEDDTWEPRSNIEEGAGTVLQDYIAAKEAEGNAVVDPADKKKKPRASEPVKKAEPVEKKKPRASEIRLPDSRDSSLSSSKKAKKPDSIGESLPQISLTP